MSSLGIVVDIVYLSPTVSLADALDDAASRGLLYAVIVTSQHELHHSVTLTILHGRNPQGEESRHYTQLPVAIVTSSGKKHVDYFVIVYQQQLCPKIIFSSMRRFVLLSLFFFQ